MTLEELYGYAVKKDISVFSRPLKRRKALCVKTENEAAIAIDNEVIANEREEKMVLAEEIAHVEGDLVYPLSARPEKLHSLLISKAEYGAKCRKLKLLIPFEELKAAVNSGLKEVWELSDYFGVPETAVTEAVEYYRTQGLYCPADVQKQP